jgi:acetyltransferase
MRIIGPNTAGIANSSNGFNPCPYEAGYHRLEQGSVAICSQSGMTNPQGFPYSEMAYGVSKICDFGNKCDLDECDLLEYFEKDARTAVVSMYLEGIRDGQRLLAVAKQVCTRKPVLILKSGTTREGASASSSHTGSLAVDDRVFDAVCKQAGILRLEKFDDVFEMPKIFALQPLPKGNRLGIVSYTGGVGVLAIDQAAKHGLRLTSLTSETARMLDGFFPGLSKMPVDIGPMAPAVDNFFELYPRILNAVMSDGNVDALFNVIWAVPAQGVLEAYAETYASIRNMSYEKPLATWIYGPDLTAVRTLAKRLERLSFPVFKSPEKAIQALGLASKYAQVAADT